MLGVRPTPFPNSPDSPGARIARARFAIGILQKHRSCSVPKQSGRDEHRGTLITHSQADSAKIDGKKKNGCIRHALCKPRRSREAAAAAAASKSKNRQALDGRRKSKPGYQAGIE